MGDSSQTTSYRSGGRMRLISSSSGGSESHSAGFAAIDEAAALHRLRRRLVRLELGLLAGVRLAHHGHGALRLEERHFATTKSPACAQTRDAVGRKLARRHLRPGVYFLRVGLDTSRRRATEASAPLERTPTSIRGVAGQLPRPARRSKKWPVRRGLRGRAARGGVLWPGPYSFIILEAAEGAGTRRATRGDFPSHS